MKVFLQKYLLKVCVIGLFVLFGFTSYIDVEAADANKHIHSDKSVWEDSFFYGYEKTPYASFENYNKQIRVRFNTKNRIYSKEHNYESGKYSVSVWSLDKNGFSDDRIYKDIQYFENGQAEIIIPIDKIKADKKYEITVLLSQYTEKDKVFYEMCRVDFLKSGNKIYFGFNKEENHINNYNAYKKNVSQLEKFKPKDYLTNYRESTLAPKEKKSKDFALKLVKNAKSDKEKVTIISKWINDNIKYTSSMKNRYLIADDVLKNKKGRCAEYSFLMRAMLNAVDIPCVYVSSRQQNHAWNMVYIDNQWITMDSTNATIAASAVDTVSTYNWKDAELGILGVNVTTNVKNDKGKLLGYTVNESYLELVKPYRSGYKFDGWYSANSGGVNLTKKDLIKIIPHKVYARWSKKGKVYQITFNKNGGTRLSKSSLKVTQGNEYGKLPTTIRKNYTFKGWYTKKSGGKKVSASTKVNLTKNQTLYAQWSKVKKPGKAVITGKKNNKPGQMSIWWKKIKGAAGYQIVYSSNKDFKAVNKVTVTSNKKTIKGLKKGRTYYLKVRAYNVDSMKNKFYGKYSTVTKVKIKK